MSDFDHLKKLIWNYNRRLQKLEEERSLKGFSADPELIIEIEDTTREIEKLKAELDKIDEEQSNTTTDVTTSDGAREKPPQAKNVTKEQILGCLDRISRHLFQDHEFPIEMSIDEFVDEIREVKGVAPEEAKGFLTAFFDLLSIIGAVRVKDSGRVELSDEIHLATMRALSLAIQENLSGLFDFSDSEDIENPYYGSWFLHLLERRRQDNNPQREESRVCDTVAVLVKAKLEGEEAILFQSDGERAWAKYKLIGGRVRYLDRGSLSEAARREIRQEVRTKVQSASNIKVWSLSEEPFEYYVISRRLGAFTLYRTHVYECTLDLPDGCLRSSFQGEKGRDTSWFPINQITPDNDELSQTELLRWIRTNEWFGSSRLSTRQVIKND